MTYIRGLKIGFSVFSLVFPTGVNMILVVNGYEKMSQISFLSFQIIFMLVAAYGWIFPED